MSPRIWWVYDKGANARHAEIIVRKNRAGSMYGVARVRFDGPTTNFYDAISDATVAFR
jgi:replicative DNA helicase